jgi:thioredoxin 1
MLSVNAANFEQEVKKAEVTVLCDFWAPWCPPCRALTPVLEQLDSVSEGKYKIVKVDIDQCPDLASEYNVSSIPTILVFKNGSVEQRLVGLQPKEKLEQVLK